ncbi:MAG: hypothetical protein J6Q02_13300, partial [Lachnospiraceae bacterium]|nr:hypothetical protein [Lachnospiraceae bacterium]
MLIIFREYPNASSNYVVTAMPGEDAEDEVMDAEAREILQYYRQGEEVTVKYSRMENGEYVSHEVTVVLGGAQQTK